MNLIIKRFIRDINTNRIIGSKILRSVNVHPSFQGIGERGVIIRAEFDKLASILEPSYETFSVT